LPSRCSLFYPDLARLNEAVRHARAVAAVLQQAVTTGELDDVREQLKDEWRSF
jgi:uncharacterized protein (DUF2267 family)